MKFKKKQTVLNRIAIIDLGTNSIRMDIYRISDSKVIRVYRGKMMVRLGDGVFRTGRLSSKGIERTLLALTKFSKIIKQKKVKKTIAFGTSALRTAKDSKIFLREVKKVTDIDVRVISGKEESRLISLGVLANIELPIGHFCLVDIGGGSTEVSICLGNKVIKSHSLPLGANRLQQLFFPTIPPEFKKGQVHPVLSLRQHLKNELFALSKMCMKYPLGLVIGSSGTIRSIERIMEKAGKKGKYITRATISAFISELQTMNREQIKKIPGIEEKRVDLILAGSILLEEILFAVKVKKMVATELALRDGILEEELKSYSK